MESSKEMIETTKVLQLHADAVTSVLRKELDAERQRNMMLGDKCEQLDKDLQDARSEIGRLIMERNKVSR